MRGDTWKMGKILSTWNPREKWTLLYILSKIISSVLNVCDACYPVPGVIDQGDYTGNQLGMTRWSWVPSWVWNSKFVWAPDGMITCSVIFSSSTQGPKRTDWWVDQDWGLVARLCQQVSRRGLCPIMRVSFKCPLSQEGWGLLAGD